MAALTASTRKKLPKSDFAVQTQTYVKGRDGKMRRKMINKYPVDTKARAVAAKAYVNKAKPPLTPEQKKAVIRKANKKLYGKSTVNTLLAKKSRDKRTLK